MALSLPRRLLEHPILLLNRVQWLREDCASRSGCPAQGSLLLRLERGALGVIVFVSIFFLAHLCEALGIVLSSLPFDRAWSLLFGVSLDNAQFAENTAHFAQRSALLLLGVLLFWAVHRLRTISLISILSLVR